MGSRERTTIADAAEDKPASATIRMIHRKDMANLSLHSQRSTCSAGILQLGRSISSPLVLRQVVPACRRWSMTDDQCPIDDVPEPQQLEDHKEGETLSTDEHRWTQMKHPALSHPC
jgi:hypothetical protein